MKKGAVPLRELVKRSASSEMNGGKGAKKAKSAAEEDDEEWAKIERMQIKKGGAKPSSVLASSNAAAGGDGSCKSSKKGKKKGKGKGGDKKSTAKAKSKGIGGKDGDDDEWTSDDSDDENEVEGGGMSLEGGDNGKIENFTFEFRDMLETFEEGITTLLKSSLIPNPTEAYNVAHIIAKQDIVGTSVLCEGGDDIFAFSSIVPYSMLQSTCIPRVLNPIRTHNIAQKRIDFLPELQEMLENVDTNKLGIMFHRRFVNFPLQLLGPLHQNLMEDLAWARGSSDAAVDDALAADDEDSLRFRALSHVLLFTRGMLEMPVSSKASKSASSNSDSNSSSSSSGGSSSSNVTITNITGANGVMFESFEDEIYCQFADLVLQLNNTSATAIPSNVVVALIPLNNFAKIKQEIEKLSNFGN